MESTFSFCRFYICNNNHKREFSCADGFHWNSQSEKCLFEEDADCNVGFNNAKTLDKFQNSLYFLLADNCG